MHVLAVRIMNTASDTILSEISSPEEIYFIFLKLRMKKIILKYVTGSSYGKEDLIKVIVYKKKIDVL